MLSIESLTRTLLHHQNPDGGWGYNGAVSWTEPTACAVLALMREQPEAAARGIRWLKQMQGSDGGWPPAAAVHQSTWVTAPAVLALCRAGQPGESNRSVAWLSEQTGQESHWTVRIRRFLLGADEGHTMQYAGWPWYPGAAAWVTPTAFGIFALRALFACGIAQDEGRLAEAQNFLISRACRDGGWNHGSSRALGFESPSYPETTGIALLALSGFRHPALSKAVSCAQHHLASCHSRNAASWLLLGLLAQGMQAADLRKRIQPCVGPPRGLIDTAVALIAEWSLEGRNVLLG